MSHLVACRAQSTARCLHGQPTTEAFGEDLPLAEDGTFDALTATIVCDPCYVRLMPLTPSGRGLHHELDAAIAAAR